MPKLRAIAAAMLLCAVLTGCGDDNDAPGWTALMMARTIAAGEEMTEFVPGDELFEEYIAGYYGIDTDTLSDGAILTAGGASAREVAVLYFTSASAAGEAADRLREYLDAREADFTGYAPGEAEMLSRAGVVVRNAWCALIVLPDSAAGAEAFERCFTSSPPEDSAGPVQTADTAVTPSPGPAAMTPSPEPTAVTPSPEPTAAQAGEEDGWTYSEQRIISAYRSGEWASLHENDRAILEAVQHVLTEVAPEGLSDYERELAIHDYIIGVAQYDSDTLSLLPGFEEDPNNSNPYGTLISGRAVCRGYSSTFQLFMDLIGVECITVEGFGNVSRDEHAWNMVRLDGEWYCVDVTWDDPVGLGQVFDAVSHRYFNVTSEFMRSTNHYWDETAVPEATGTRYAWAE